MKKSILMIILVLSVILGNVSCQKDTPTDNQTQENNPATQQENEPTQNKKTNPEGKENKQEAQQNTFRQLHGIFYGTQEDKPDLLVFDFDLYEKPMLLDDEARVFFSEKPMNTLVDLKITEQDDHLLIVSADLIDTFDIRAKYDGLADNNHAVFQFGEKGFVVQVSPEMTEKLSKLNTNELYTVTIKQNEIEQANPVLLDLK